MNLRETLFFARWLKRKGVFEDYIEHSGMGLGEVDMLKVVVTTLPWSETANGVKRWSELDKEWAMYANNYYKPNIPVKCRIDSGADWRMIPREAFSFPDAEGITLCFKHSGIAARPTGGGNYYWLMNLDICGEHGQILKDLGISREFVRNAFPTDAKAHSRAFEDDALCSPAFITPEGLFDYISLLYSFDDDFNKPKDTLPIGYVTSLNDMIIATSDSSARVDVNMFRGAPATDITHEQIVEALKEWPAEVNPLPPIKKKTPKHIVL